MGLSHTHILLTTELLKQCTVYNNIIVIIIGLKVDIKHTVEPDEKDVCTEHLTHSLHNRCPKERSVFSVESHFKGVQQILCFLSPMWRYAAQFYLTKLFVKRSFGPIIFRRTRKSNHSIKLSPRSITFMHTVKCYSFIQSTLCIKCLYTFFQ